MALAESVAFQSIASALRGRYQLIREIGSGGMATVYVAHDLRHDREVAIKLLRPELASMLGAERFLSEIKTTARLSHPHILPLFDSGESEGLLFYVMPVVTGESLRDRLQREKQLSIAEAVRITQAVASALDYAHRSGVIHRDIKPANILLHDGQPVVSDFGIALAVKAAGGDRLTDTGLSLGTPDYMSPEQASGERTIDARSDLFSLACVAYEMMAGEPPFKAPTAAATISRVVTSAPPPLAERRPTVPPNVSGAVARALEKLPADRFEKMIAFADALADPNFRWPHVPGLARSSRVPWLIAAAAVLGVVALSSWRWGRGGSTGRAPPIVRLGFTLPEDLYLPAGPTRSVLELSPDGTQLVYVAHDGQDQQLFIRQIGAFESRALPGSRGAREPFFSPDGQWIGFFAAGKLKKVPITGGLPVELADVSGPAYGGSWGDNGAILYSLGGTSLWSIPQDGGAPREIPVVINARRDATSKSDSTRPVRPPLKWPRMLPGGTRALVSVGWQDEQGRENQAGLVGVVELSSGKFTTLFGGSKPYFVSTGHIVFDAGLENIRVIRFDIDRLRTIGPATPIASNALRSSGSGTNFSAAYRTGTIAYPTGGFERRLVIADRYGRETPIGIPARGYRFPSTSPDGRFAAVTVDPQPPQIWIVDLARERATPLTSEGYNLYAMWAPDGRRIAFARNEPAPNLYLIDWPSGIAKRVLAGHGIPRWGRGDQLFVSPDGADDILLFDLNRGSSKPFLSTPAHEHQPAISPDGKWVAFASNVSGTEEVYAMPYDGGMPRAVSSGGGTEPRWARDGTELYFRRGNTTLAVKVRTEPTFEVLGGVVTLFTEPYDYSVDDNWDVLPNGRFLMVRGGPNQGREIRFVLNAIR